MARFRIPLNLKFKIWLEFEILNLPAPRNFGILKFYARGGILKFRYADAISKSGAARAKIANFTQQVAASFKTAPMHVYGISKFDENGRLANAVKFGRSIE